MKNKFAIYTACIGGYDNILQPEVIDECFDYILFTDDVVEDMQIGIWQIRHVDYTHKDKTRIARYVKTHPHELLPEYDATLWMDSSLQIASQAVYERFMTLVTSGMDMASVKHPKRDCIYEEAYEVASRKSPGALEYDEIALQWCHKLWKERYPRHNGLFETSILFRQNNDTMRGINELWWDCIDSYSKRDQLSFNYAIWKRKPLAGEFLQNGEHMMNSDKIKFVGHSKISVRKALRLNKFQWVRYRYRVEDKKHALEQWFAMMKMPLPLLWLHTLGTFTAINYKLASKLWA